MASRACSEDSGGLVLMADARTMAPVGLKTREDQGKDSMTENSLAISMVSGIPVAHWNPVRHSIPVANFGDLLGPLIAARLVAPSTRPAPADPATLVSVGSILHLAPPRAVVWGSGVNGKALEASRRMPRDLDVRSVRGPWTQRLLTSLGLEVPSIYGDPALLLPYVMPELVATARVPRREVLVVPNFNDHTGASVEAGALGLDVLDSRAQLDSVLLTIASSRLVIGSSLHAVVVAEALGLPARFVRSENEHPFKYRDYLAGTGREFEPIAASVEEALAWGGQPAPVYDVDALMEAFPHDLWSGGGSATSDSGDAAMADPVVSSTDALWIDALSGEGSQVLGQDSAEYEARLQHLLGDADLGDRAASTRWAAELIEVRRWHYPEAKVDGLPGTVRDIDRSLRSRDPESVLRAVARARRGIHAVAYNLVQRPVGSILSISVTVPDSEASIKRVWLTQGELEIAVGAFAIPEVRSQIDLDVVVPENWDMRRMSDLTVRVEYAQGADDRAALEWSTSMPSTDVLSDRDLKNELSKSPITVGAE